MGGPVGSAIGAIFGAFWDDLFGDDLDKTTMTVISRIFNPSSARRRIRLIAPRPSAMLADRRAQAVHWVRTTARDFDEDEITCLGSVFSQKFDTRFVGFDTGDRKEFGKATIRVEVPQRFKEPVTVNGTKSLFLTGRGVSSCPDLRPPIFDPPTIVWASTLEPENTDDPRNKLPTSDVGKTGAMSRTDANTLGGVIRKKVLKSRNDIKARLPRGVVSFAESDMVAEMLAKVVDSSPADNVSLTRWSGINEKVLTALKKKGGRVTRKDILRASLTQIASHFEISYAEARELRRSVMGLLTKDQAKARLDDLRKPVMTKVPNLVGLHLEEAQAKLTAVDLRLGAREFGDDACPRAP